MKLPLAPFTILEAAGPAAQEMHHLALGLAGRIAADLGATVLRIVPETGDPLDNMPVLPWEKDKSPQALSTFLNASKTLIPLAANDTDMLAQLLSEADGVLTFEELLPDPGGACINVRLATLPAGHPFETNDGPPIGELGLLALSGLLDVVGDPDREPLALGGHQAAYAAGLACFSAMMTGLAGSTATGEGDTYDVNMLDTLALINWKSVAGSLLGSEQLVTREGGDAEWQVLRAADGWIALVFTERDWPQLVELIGNSALAKAELKTMAGRAEHHQEYLHHLEAWAENHTREEIYRNAQARRIPIAPVVELDEMLDDPQVRDRAMFASVKSNRTGDEMTLPLAPVIWSGKRFLPSSHKISSASDWLEKQRAGA